MPKPKFPNVHREKTRHGKTVWYYRRSSGSRSRLPFDPTDPRFPDAYKAIASGAVAERPPRVPRPRPTADTYVYFLRCGSLVKIGYSNNPFSRVSSLKTGNPEKVTLFLMVPGTRSDERAIHEKLVAHRAQGEWYKLSPAVRALMARAAAYGAPLHD